MSYSTWYICWLSGILLFCVSSVSAQDSIEIPRLEEPIVLDGRTDDPAWEAIDPLPMTMYQPTYQGEMSERTEVRIAHDGEYLYVAGRLYDSNPEGIRANSLYRDRYSGDDTFAVIIDPFNDNENALWFFTNPAGVRFDMAVSNDAEDGLGTPINSNWTTFWTAEAVQTSEGWFAEIRIPFSSLGFQADGGTVEMGLSTYRFLARKNERHTFPSIPPDWSRGFAKPSQAQDVVLRDVEARRPVHVTPYMLGGFNQEAHLPSDAAGYEQERTIEREVGVDVKYNVTSNLTLDLTVNTDFAQVEADPQRIDLSRFPLFFPEQRRFFQERASTFAFTTGGNDRLFHSRRIGLVDGEPVRLLGGARLVGRVEDWDIGALNMQTAQSAQLDVPSENFSVVRARRQVLNQNSYAGGIATTRIDAEGGYNIAHGWDSVLRLVNEEYLTLRVAQTVDRADIRSNGWRPEATTLGLIRWERRRNEGLHYQGTAIRAGADYQPAVGFTTRQNFTELRGQVGYGVFPGAESRFTSFTPSIRGTAAYRNADGTIESFQLEHEWELAFKSGRSIDVGVETQLEDLRDPLPFPEDTVVPPGRYTFVTARMGYGAPDGRLLRVDANTSIGEFFDGWRWQAEVSPTWNLSRHLELEGTYQVNRVRFSDRDQQFLAHIARMRVQVALNRRVSTTAFMQYNSDLSEATIDVRFRYNFDEGHDLWVVYNEGLNFDRHRATPTLPMTNARNVVVKYTHTLSL